MAENNQFADVRASRRVSNPVGSRFLDAASRFFARACHSIGFIFLRVLSTFMLVTGLVGTVVLTLWAYYYLGVLNPHPLIATLLYIPSLIALSVLREEMLTFGTNDETGMGPSRESHAVAMSYISIMVASFFSLVHPIWMRSNNYIAARSMWTAIGATALFYYSLLMSEVLYASALNVRRSRLRRKYQKEQAQRLAAGQGRPVAAAEASSMPPNDAADEGLDKVESFY